MAANTTPTLNATVREGTGTGPARRVRQEGLVPCICYGHGIDNLNLAIDPAEFDKLSETERGLNTVFHVEVEGGDKLEHIMLRDYQIDPVGRQLIHADLVAVDPKKPLRVKIPVEPEGEAEGVKVGGRLQFVRRNVEVFVPPSNIPESITVDVSHLGPEDAIMADDLEYPESVEPSHKVDYALLRIQMPREEIVTTAGPTATAAVTPTTEEGEEIEEGAEGAEEEGAGAEAKPPGA